MLHIQPRTWNRNVPRRSYVLSRSKIRGPQCGRRYTVSEYEEVRPHTSVFQSTYLTLGSPPGRGVRSNVTYTLELKSLD